VSLGQYFMCTTGARHVIDTVCKPGLDVRIRWVVATELREIEIPADFCGELCGRGWPMIAIRYNTSVPRNLAPSVTISIEVLLGLSSG
jgi:hypothetical protein